MNSRSVQTQISNSIYFRKSLQYLLVILTLGIIYSSKIFAQIEIQEGRNDVAIPTDSIFSCFVKPTIDSTIYQKYIDPIAGKDQNLMVLCIMSVNNNHKVRQLLTYPIYEYGNSFEEGHEIWGAVKNSLDSVSKLWIIKPSIHKITQEFTEPEKLYYSDINRKILNGEASSIKGPNAGFQEHMFIINIYLGSGLSSTEEIEPMLLYWLYVSPLIK